MVTPVKKVPIHLQSSQNRIIIKNGTVVNHDKEEQMDIYIEVRLYMLKPLSWETFVKVMFAKNNSEQVLNYKMLYTL